MKQIAVIGGGASGMIAAIAAHGKNAKVTLFEASDRVGKKILVTGNGKCNFTNEYIAKDCYNGSDVDYIMNVLGRFGRDRLVDFFRNLGMFATVKRGGYYPYSGQASTVLDCLRNELSFKGITVKTGVCVNGISHTPKGYILDLTEEGKKKKSSCYDKVIVSIGSIAGQRGAKADKHYSLLKDLGIKLNPVVPALVQLTCEEEYIKALSGVRFDGTVVLCKGDKVLATESGEVQLTDYGISGIPTFQLSRIAAYELLKGGTLTAFLDFLPDISKEELIQILLFRQVKNTEQTVEEYFLGITNKKVEMLVLKLLGIKPTSNACLINDGVKTAFAEVLKGFKLHINGTKGYENAQICAGGVDLSELNENLELVNHPGIYVTGEALDVDGRCGGYNLQWAFASGYLAGSHAGSN